MTVTIGSVAGTKFFIGDSNDAPSPDNYIEVTNISSLGDLSQDFTPITVESIGSGDSTTIKGTRMFPNIALVMNRDDSDENRKFCNSRHVVQLQNP